MPKAQGREKLKGLPRAGSDVSKSSWEEEETALSTGQHPPPRCQNAACLCRLPALGCIPGDPDVFTDQLENQPPKETLETQEKGIWNVLVYTLETVFIIKAAGLRINPEYFPGPDKLLGSKNQIVLQKWKRFTE